MFGKITQAVVKKTAKTLAVGALEGLSTILDKGAEFADEASDFVDSLGKEEKGKARDIRNEKRDS